MKLQIIALTALGCVLTTSLGLSLSASQSLAAEVEVTPSAVPAKTPCDWLVEVKRTNTWLERDQAPQKLISEFYRDARKRGVEIDVSEANRIKASMRAENAILMSELDDLVNRCGWPSTTEFGDKAPQYAALLVQHAPLEVQLRYYPLMEEAAKANELPYRLVAALDDRIRYFQKRPQLYGSQIVDDEKTGGLRLWDVEDPTHLDERRSRAGMIPAGSCAYISMFTPTVKYEPCEEKPKKSAAKGTKRAL